jgi:hypothetical protein
LAQPRNDSGAGAIFFGFRMDRLIVLLSVVSRSSRSLEWDFMEQGIFILPTPQQYHRIQRSTLNLRTAGRPFSWNQHRAEEGRQQ